MYFDHLRVKCDQIGTLVTDIWVWFGARSEDIPDCKLVFPCLIIPFLLYFDEARTEKLTNNAENGQNFVKTIYKQFIRASNFMILENESRILHISCARG